MKKGDSRFLCFLLVAVMLFGILPLFAVPADGASQETDLTATVEQQIRAFADSIDQKNADDAAAMALASHGMTKGGKKLSVGKNHALTATLLNSELLQSGLIKSCTAAIAYMQTFHLESMPYITGNCCWYGVDGSYFTCRNTDGLGSEFEHIDCFLNKDATHANAYDDALDWIAGYTASRMNIVRTKVTAAEATYKVTLTILDRFDFATSSGSGFKNLISGIGALFFKEFDWESTVSFNLTVPYTCTHSQGAYHWTYDSQNHTMTSHTDDGNIKNDAIHNTEILYDGSVTHYYRLEETVLLSHEKPWVMEYSANKPGNLLFGPTDDLIISNKLVLRHYSSSGVFAKNSRYITASDEIKEQYGPTITGLLSYNYCGTPLSRLFSYNTSKICNFRFENIIHPDGSNMIYLTVSEAETGVVLLDAVPLDDHYTSLQWSNKYDLVSKSSDWLSGQDLYIQYFGQKGISFAPGYLDLRIWTNGEDGEAYSYYEKSAVTAPTCTAKGYTTYVCAACGHSKKADYVAAGHRWGDWEEISETHRQHTCTVCGESEQEEIPALQFLPGDINGDGSVNNKDLTRLFQYLSGWDVEVEEQTLDINGDGAVNNKDLTRLFQYLSGWNVEIH